MRPLLLLASLLTAGLFGSPAANPVPFPYHAFCRTVWLFSMPCADVGAKLVQQIHAFSPVHGCEKCHYVPYRKYDSPGLHAILMNCELVSTTKTSIEVHHTSPDRLHVESIEFTLHTNDHQSSSCHVNAQSASLAFSSLLDGGLNYCNLNNLLTASGLNYAPGFLEMTSEWACLGYVFATCRT